MLPRGLLGVSQSFVVCTFLLCLRSTQGDESYEDYVSGEELTCADFTGSYLSPSDYSVVNVSQGPPDYDCSSMNFKFPNGNTGYGRAKGNKLYLGKGRFVGTYHGDEDKAYVSFNHKDNWGVDYVWVKLDNDCEEVDGTWKGKINLAGIFNLGAGSTLNGEFELMQHNCKVILKAPAGHPEWPKEQVVGAVVGNKIFTVFHTNGVVAIAGQLATIHWPDGSHWNRIARLVKNHHLAQDVQVGAQSIALDDSTGFNVGDYVRIGNEVRRVDSVSPMKLSIPLAQTYPAGTQILKMKPDDPDLKAAVSRDPCAPTVLQGKSLDIREGVLHDSPRTAREEPASSRLSQSFLGFSCVMLAVVGVACFVRTAKNMWLRDAEGHRSSLEFESEVASAELQERRPLSEESALLTVEDKTV